MSLQGGGVSSSPNFDAKLGCLRLVENLGCSASALEGMEVL